MKHLFKLFSLFGLLIIMSCASNIRSKKYTDDDFNKFKTFAYLPNTSFSIEEFNTSEDKSIEASLIATMNDKMVEKGFSIDTGNPDLLVLLSTSNEIKSNLQNTRNNYEQAPSGGSTSGASPNYAAISSTDYKRYFSNSEDALYNKPYKKGTLIVQVFSKASKELVWVGIAEDFKAHISDQTLMTRMISEIFEEFPI
ncbi:DUF4136 domain-containing protein [Winogradskyella tangerina]|uniref:DUF4136 domain-containing protein n=1 Tax=Winogradskyella tangerina TaxID=2023240 RepID=UPI000DBE9440|nr:DUF4136 domain-containing protein [Winogradskyella tangerina]